LVRQFRLSADTAVKDLYLRVAVGKSITEKEGAYTIDGRLTYRLKLTPTSKPVIREVAGGQQKELLIPVRFSAVTGGGKGLQEARIELDLTW
jgi:hypothetical protein